MIYLYFYLVKQKQKLKRKMTVNNIRIIQEVLDNNSQNIPENDLMTGLNALMAINNSQSNENALNRIINDGYGGFTEVDYDGEPSLHHTLGRFYITSSINLHTLLPRQIPYCIASLIIKKLKKRNDEGFRYADLIFSDEFEGDDLVNIDSMRDSVIPHLQKLGFDTYLFFDDNDDWDRSLCIAWESNVIPYMLGNDTNYWNRFTYPYLRWGRCK